MTNYEVGGKISVTLKDGTKIVDSWIEGTSNYPHIRYIAGGNLCLKDSLGELGASILSVDSYTPPTPVWAAENVRIIQSKIQGFLKAFRDTRGGKPLSDDWVFEGETCTTRELQDLADDWEIYGVAP